MKYIRILTAAFVLLFVFIIFSADRGTMPRLIASLYDYPYGDKVGHIFLMGALSFLVNLNLACRRIRVGRFRLLLGSLVIAVLIALEEISQSFFPHRHCDLSDLSASDLGIFLLGRLAVVVYNKFLAQPCQ